SADTKIKYRVQIGDCISKVAYSPDGSIFAVAVAGDERGPANEVRLFSSNDGQSLASLKSDNGSPEAVAFTPAGFNLILVAKDGECILWDLKNYKRTATLKGDWDSPDDVVISPDGKQFVVCGGDKDVEVWDFATRTRVTKLQSGDERIMCLAFSPDGTMLAG